MPRCYRNLHAALEQRDERDDPLIPERQVGEHTGHGPAVRHRATQSRVVELADECFEAATFAIGLSDVRAVGGHAWPPFFSDERSPPPDGEHSRSRADSATQGARQSPESA